MCRKNNVTWTNFFCFRLNLCHMISCMAVGLETFKLRDNRWLETAPRYSVSIENLVSFWIKLNPLHFISPASVTSIKSYITLDSFFNIFVILHVAFLFTTKALVTINSMILAFLLKIINHSADHAITKNTTNMIKEKCIL